MVSVPAFNILSATSFALACLLDPGTVAPDKSSTGANNSVGVTDPEVDARKEASDLESDSAYDTFCTPEKYALHAWFLDRLVLITAAFAQGVCWTLITTASGLIAA